MTLGLFTDVYRYANFKTRERREVLLTAALSYCLESVPLFRASILTRGCRIAAVPMPRGRSPSTVRVAHQESYRRIDDDDLSRVGFDRPDIVIQYPSGSLSCAIECKLRGIVSDGQAGRYATQLLASAEGKRCVLIVVSTERQRKPSNLGDVGWASLTWTDVDDLARTAEKGLRGRINIIPRYLLTELRRLLMSEELAFRGFQPQQLGQSAGRALSAYCAWYDLVKLARRQLRDLIAPRSNGRETLRRNFTGVGFEAIGKWDLRKVRRTKLHLWVGVYPYQDGDGYSTDWYPGAVLAFGRHPQRLQIIQDRSFMRAARRFCDRHGFELLPDGFAVHGDTIPATKLLRGYKTPAAQQERVLEHWTKQVRAFCDGELASTLLDYH